MKTLFSYGISYREAPVGLRERLAVGASDFGRQCRALSAALGGAQVVILSTCNRVELYAVAEADAGSEVLESWFRRRAQVSLECLRRRSGVEAVRHFFRVCAGLESMVLGESEILGQVRRAYQASRDAATAGREMNILFQKGLWLGKKVRTSTALQTGISSVGGAAAALAAKIFGETGGRTLLLGAGKMAALTAKHMFAKNFTGLTVANRSLRSAQRLAAEFGGIGLPLASGLSRLAEFDVVICSTSSPEPVLRADRVADALRARSGRGILFIDIAVPRDVCAGVADLNGAYLYNIDDLYGVVQRSLDERAGAVENATRMIEAVQSRFLDERGPSFGVPAVRSFSPVEKFAWSPCPL